MSTGGNLTGSGTDPIKNMSYAIACELSCNAYGSIGIAVTKKGEGNSVLDSCRRPGNMFAKMIDMGDNFKNHDGFINDNKGFFTTIKGDIPE